MRAKPHNTFGRDFLDLLLEELRLHPQGLSEFELIRRLQRRTDVPLDPAALREPVSLYRTHFLLFHSLYKLRERLQRHGEDMEINCLRIAITGPRERAAGGLGEHDPLGAFYLDTANLEGVTEAEVLRMLGDFWHRFGRPGGKRRRWALETLGLADPVSADEIKLQYRRLVMQHHPDRGGDTATVQRLNEAMEILS